jgi:hypothetical protein
MKERNEESPYQHSFQASGVAFKAFKEKVHLS